MSQVTMATEYPCVYVYACVCVCVCVYVYMWFGHGTKGYQLGAMNQIESVSPVYAYQRRLEGKNKNSISLVKVPHHRVT